MPLGAEHVEGVSDYLVWYAKDKSSLRAYPIYRDKDAEGDTQWSWVELPDGLRRRMLPEEIDRHSLLSKGSKISNQYRFWPIIARTRISSFRLRGQHTGPPARPLDAGVGKPIAQEWRRSRSLGACTRQPTPRNKTLTRVPRGTSKGWC
jgi:hypothetical protein